MSTRMKRLAAGLVGVMVVTGLAATSGSSWLGSASAATSGHVRAVPDTAIRAFTWTGLEHHTLFIDNGQSGPSLGDEQVFVGALVNGSGVKVGHFEGTLTSMSSDDNTLQAQVTLVLARGQIAAQGELDFTAAQPFKHAVIGGTGAFLGARGLFEFWHLGPGHLKIRVRLLT
jgi:Dirigent-like protein